MLASTRHDVTLLNQIAQRQVHGNQRRGRHLTFDDGTLIGAGDQIITRRNNRRLALSGSDWVKNGDRWTVTTVRRDGSIDVTSQRNGLRTRLPASYVDQHVQLGYATTIHTAQGLTTDTSHTLLNGEETRQQLYTAITRGREGTACLTLRKALGSSPRVSRE